MKKGMKYLMGWMLAAVVGLTGCGGSHSFQEETVLKIDERDILKSEYMIYLYSTTQSFLSAAGTDVWNMDFDGQTADELLEERTIETIQNVVAAEKYAAANEISLTEEQKEEARQAAEQFVAMVSAEDLAKMGMDAESAAPVMEASYLYSLVYNEIAAECEVDAGELQKYRTENEAALRKDYAEVQVQTIFLDNLEKAEKAVQRARDGEDFAALYAEYDVQQSDDGEAREPITMYQSYLKMSFGLTEDLQTGDITDPIQIDENGYMVMQVLSVEEATEEELNEIAEAAYTNQVQTDYANARLEEMVQAQAVEKAEGVWEDMEKFH